MQLVEVLGITADGGEFRAGGDVMPDRFRISVVQSAFGRPIWLYITGMDAKVLAMNVSKNCWIAALGAMRNWYDKNGTKIPYVYCFEIKLLTRPKNSVDLLATEGNQVAELMMTWRDDQ